MRIIIILVNLLFFFNLVYCQTEWYWQNPLPTGNHLLSTFFVDDNTGWAVGNSGTVVKTSDGGSSWISQTSGVYNDLYSVFFTNGSTGWAVGLGAGSLGQSGGIIINTTNGGTNWITQFTPGPSEWLTSVCFTNSNTGWAVGLGQTGGIIYKTTNGGTNWLTQSSNTSNALVSVFFINSNIGWAGLIY